MHKTITLYIITNFVLKTYRVLLLIIVGIFGFFFQIASADDGGFTIDSYDVHMDIHSDGSMDVTENIIVIFSEERHGIYREIPIKDANGDYTHIKNLNAENDPVADNSIVGNNYTLKIWSASEVVMWLKGYKITYTVLNAIKAYASGSTTTSGAWQELYWNLIWNNRNTSINKVTFTVNLPKDHTFNKKDMFAIWWAQGDKNIQNIVLEQTDAHTIKGGLNSVLQAHEWVTLGLQFPDDYFFADGNYNDMFAKAPEGVEKEKSFRDKIGNLLEDFFWSILNILIFIIIIGGIFSKRRWSPSGSKPAWRSEKAITPYYLPPRNIDPTEAFWFWFNAQNSQVFIALIYYWATKWWTHISYKEWKKYFLGIKWEPSYNIIENIEAPTDSTPLDKELLQKFFGKPDNVKDDIQLSQNSYTKIRWVLQDLQDRMDSNTQYYEKKGNIFTKKYVLTPQGEQLFEEMRGFKEYLSKVERPVIDMELKKDPAYFNKILPWAVLFGVQTHLLRICEDILNQVEWYDSYNGRPLNVVAFNSMTSNIKSSAIAPRSSGSSWSWFSSGWWFSGGGGWWGWWGSW